MEIKGKGTVFYNTQYGKWSISDNQKNMEGKYDKYYIPVSFPKSMNDLPNDRDFISIEGFTKPFKKKDGSTGMSYMILKWEDASTKNTISTGNSAVSVETTQSSTENIAESDPYQEFANEVVIDPNDLPF